ncbi:(2Fe-2S)-binding protein [Lewinella sp. IMCC34183]|uniref:(2Fe-2S)-binding protein n=1 Tax=Lewinella sp. IMCC34183 TaxID=2248762 RepID=UPI000E25E1C8|nr:(2Fe-2S)-binding protein [Lewinella sp. IMCC34183]
MSSNTESATENGYPAAPHRNKITLTVNGQKHELSLSPWTTLLDALRQQLHLTGTKKGCDHGQCGACTVLRDGENVNSCLCLAVMQEGSEIVTVEGLAAEDGTLHPVQQAFLENDGYQCGYCTPGQICSTVALLEHDRGNSPAEIRDLMSGNLCRCGAYTNIYNTIAELQGAKQSGSDHE